MAAFSGEAGRRCSTNGAFKGDLYSDEICIDSALTFNFSRWLKPISAIALAGGVGVQPATINPAVIIPARRKNLEGRSFENIFIALTMSPIDKIFNSMAQAGL
ncbi:MAG: hypothetical protein OEL50_04390 [Rhodospirillaceae bacterium]|nr:hypothetical protein [Rhodospirillaceae bacterium]